MCASPVLTIDGTGIDRVICEAGTTELLATCHPGGGGIQAQFWRRIPGSFTLLHSVTDVPGGGGSSNPPQMVFEPGSGMSGIIGVIGARATASADGVGTCESFVVATSN